MENENEVNWSGYPWWLTQIKYSFKTQDLTSIDRFNSRQFWILNFCWNSYVQVVVLLISIFWIFPKLKTNIFSVPEKRQQNRRLLSQLDETTDDFNFKNFDINAQDAEEVEADMGTLSQTVQTTW